MDVYGLVVASPEPVKSCTQTDVEVQVEKVCPLWSVHTDTDTLLGLCGRNCECNHSRSPMEGTMVQRPIANVS